MEAGRVYAMNCKEFRETMPELELSGSAGQGEHAGQCPACAALLEEQRRLAEGLRAARQEWRREEAPQRLESRLASAFRSHNGLVPQRAAFGWAPVVTWAAAAAAIIVLAMFLVHARQPQPAQRRASNGVQLATRSMGDSKAGLNAMYGEAGFIRLPNAEEIEPNEDINYVRVEVPRSSMIPLGYAVKAERASDLVQAEVVLGADGLARAVRFLDE